MKGGEDTLAFLLKLNLDLAAKESAGEPIAPPGLPRIFPDPESIITTDRIEPIWFRDVCNG
jgi:hypothetical protein